LGAIAAGLALALLPRPAAQESPDAWTEADSRLANHYIRILEADPVYGKPLDLLWELYEKKGQTALLLDYFRGASEEGPTVATLLYAHLLRKQGDAEAARPLYDRVLEEEPDSVPALKALAEIADAQKRWAKSLSLHVRLAELLPPEDEARTPVRLRKATLLRTQGQVEAAIAEWKSLLADEPENEAIRAEAIPGLIETGETEAAVAALATVAEDRDPRRRLEALLELGRLHDLTGDFAAAAEAARQAMALLHFRNPDYAEVFSRLVRLHERHERLDELEKALAEAASGDLAGERALHDLAEFHRLTADPEREEEAVARLAARAPAESGHRLRLAELQVRNDRHEAAAETLDGLLAEGGANPPLALLLRRALVDLHLSGREAAEARLAARLDQRGLGADGRRQILEFARAHYLDGIVERLLGDPASLAREAADEGAAFLELARFLHERGRTEEAVAALRSYVEPASGAPLEKAARLHRIASALRDFDRDDEALAALDEAIALAPEQIDYQTARADLFVARREIERAVAELEAIRGRKATLDERTEVDQRLFSLLRGHQAGDPTETTEPVENLNVLNQGSIQTLAQYRRLAAAASRAASSDDETLPPLLVEHYEGIKSRANERRTLEDRHRAAWWAFKLLDNPECYEQLTRATEEAGGPVVEVEKMLLALAEQNERTTLVVRHLATLIEIDPENADDYRHRRAAVRFELGYEDEAIRELRELASKPGATLATLGSLAKVYQRQGSSGRQIEVWQQAFRSAELHEKRVILRQLSNALVEAGKPEEALEAHFDLLDREADAAQRRKLLDSQITIAQTHYLLDRLRDRYAELAGSKPFDRFLPEALARIQLATGDDAAARDSMRRAYYLSGRDDELLAELGAVSDRVGDLGSAIYYRRQLLARGEGDTLDNWMELVKMLEKDLRVEEADRLRRRLESKFATDPDFLAETADHYLRTGRPRDAARLLDGVVSLRPWDREARFRLALVRAGLDEAEEAFAAFEAILAETEGEALPEGFGEGLLPLVRVGAESGPILGGESEGLERFVFTVEAYPFLGGNLQDEIADALQRPREEFALVPRDSAHLRLRAIEEAAALAQRLGRAPEWLARWRDPARPLHERLWAARHAGDGRLLASLLDARKGEGSHTDLLFLAYCRLLCGDPEGFLDWVGADDSASGTQHPRSVYGAIAALVLLKDRTHEPMRRPDTVIEALGRLAPPKSVAMHHFSELRKAGLYELATRLGTAYAEGVLADEPTFHLHLSQAAGLAGRQEDRVRWLDRALDPGAFGATGAKRLPDGFYTALTERLSLLDTDPERGDHLAELSDRLAEDAATEFAALERRLALALASRDSRAAIAELRSLVGQLQRAQQASETDPAALGHEQGQHWQRLSRHLHYYAERLRLDTKTAPEFVAAFAAEPLPNPADAAVSALYERFEIDRRILALDWLDAPERAALVRELRGSLREPESRAELAKALESRGFHRESVPIQRDDAIRRDRDYAPLQGLFDAAAEALDPEPALAVIEQINLREFPSPPGLTADYLNERHARFLLIDRDLERLAQLGRAPEGREGSPPVSSRSHLAYQDALVEAYRLVGDDASLLALLARMREGGGATATQLLLGAETLAATGRHAEALEWLSPLALDPTEAIPQRRAMFLSVESHRALGWPDRDALRSLALATLERQPPAATRRLALALHESGASSEAASLLRLLRRSSPDPVQRTETSLALLRIERESGKDWADLADELSLLFQDFSYHTDSPDTAIAAHLPAGAPRDPIVRPNAFRLAEWIGSRDEDRDALAAALAPLPSPEGRHWLAELLHAHAKGRLGPGVRALLADLPGDDDSRDPILETLPALGSEGVALALALVEESGLPGTAFLRNEPERQVAFFHRLGDRPRLAEVHAALVRESGSDLFHQSGLEDWVPTLAKRRRLPTLLAALGEADLARSLFLAYDRSIAAYQWNHAAFLNDYAAFLVESGAWEEAESLLRRVLRKSLRLDLRALPRLYAAWGKEQEWPERLRTFHLSRGQERVVAGWMEALAEGRELRETRDTW
jgi:lipopolysaccharide biosynthesis regulator YciM